MMNKIVDQVKQNVGTDLSARVGLSREQTAKGIEIAGRVTSEVVRETYAKQPAVVKNLFSKEPNTPEAKGIVDRIGKNYAETLTRELGMNALKAAAMKDAVIPSVTATVAHQVDGKEDVIKTLFA
ncbi:MAG: hypothetical protein ABI432_10875 [Flavobacteriales bacterium]